MVRVYQITKFKVSDNIALRLYTNAYFMMKVFPVMTAGPSFPKPSKIGQFQGTYV
jgi:hypothetical protein